jgi:PAS domain S-box-containing protein/diguanylate cyclase (GGDEF)-like protein
MDILYKEALNYINEGVYYTDTERKITFWNKTAEKITGYTSEEMVGTYCYDDKLQHIDAKGTKLCTGLCPLAKSIETDTIQEANVFLHHKSGYRLEVAIKTMPIHDEKTGKLIGAIELFTDISNKFNANKKITEIQKEIYIDPTTGCANKHFAKEKLKQCMQKWEKEKITFSVGIIKIENEITNKDETSRLLKAVATTTTNALRPLDNVCRWNKNELIVIVSNINMNNCSPIYDRVKTLIDNSNLEADKSKFKILISCSSINKHKTLDDMMESIYTNML